MDAIALPDYLLRSRWWGIKQQAVIDARSGVDGTEFRGMALMLEMLISI
ncbi:MAG: hypothetical protein AB4352_25495 [Hormoscilla sp.]